VEGGGSGEGGGGEEEGEGGGGVGGGAEEGWLATSHLSPPTNPPTRSPHPPPHHAQPPHPTLTLLSTSPTLRLEAHCAGGTGRRPQLPPSHPLRPTPPQPPDPTRLPTSSPTAHGPLRCSVPFKEMTDGGCEGAPCRSTLWRWRSSRAWTSGKPYLRRRQGRQWREP
jgi:hypothetical protein